MDEYRTPLSKVEGAGAARSGVHEFITHRVSAIVLALVMPFFIVGVVKAVPNGYDGIMAWIGSWCGAVTLLVFITAGLYHGRQGINEVVADYISNVGARSLWILVIGLVSLAAWIGGVMAILKIWLGA